MTVGTAEYSENVKMCDANLCNDTKILRSSNYNRCVAFAVMEVM